MVKFTITFRAYFEYFCEGCVCDHRGDLSWWLTRTTATTSDSMAASQTLVCSLRTASHHAMTTLRVWTKLEGIWQRLQLKVGEGKNLLYLSCSANSMLLMLDSMLVQGEKGRERNQSLYTKMPLHANILETTLTKCVGGTPRYADHAESRFPTLHDP